jgi:Co/Zn/Cd efflux system component
VLWIALALNAIMFAVEIVASLRAGSVSLLADAIDFFGDATNYGVSLFALGLGTVAIARASTLKAATMLGFGIWVLVRAGEKYVSGGMPHFETMTSVGAVALGVNFTVAAILYRFRSGDSNRQSAWLCTRNDVIGNLAVIAAGFVGQRLTSAAPDLLVGVGMAVLTAHSALHVLRLARAETQAAG